MKNFYPTLFLVFSIGFSLLPCHGQTSPKEFNLNPGIRFEENKGQVANLNGVVQDDILFMLKDKGINVYFRKSGISYQWYYVEELMDGPYAVSEATGGPMYGEDDDLLQEKNKESKHTVLHTYRIDMQWLNTNDNLEVLSEQPYDDYTNYYHAHCPYGINNVKSYAQVTYKNIYDGIDIVYYVKDGALKYDVHVAAGANLRNVKFAYKGATPQLENGKLLLSTPLGWMEEQQPVSWDERGKSIDIGYYKKGNKVGFKGSFSEKAMTIDPGIIWATYYGGSLDDGAGTSSVDASGNLYFSGGASSTSGIATSGGHQNTIGGGQGDAFLVKFNSSGVRQWATYYGGAGDENYPSCAVDGSGNVFLAGRTNSSSGIASGGHQLTIGGGEDSFLVKFNSSGVRQWGTYYGGSGEENWQSIVADGPGNVYLSGMTFSTSGIASSGGHQPTLGGSRDGFLAKFLSTGVRDWATYYGGTANDEGQTCSVDGSGNVYLAGWTSSSSGIATSGAYKETRESTDAFLVKFSSSGQRQWATYYGGETTDAAFATTVDGSGNVYLGGWTKSINGISSGGHQNSLGGEQDAFLIKFSSGGNRLWGTYYGGVDDDETASLEVDALGNVYLAGQTESSTGIASGCGQSTYGGGISDAFLAKFSSSGVRQWATYFGNTGEDRSRDCTVDGSNVYLTGFTTSATGIASSSSLSSHQNTFGGGVSDAFIVKFNDSDVTPPQITGNTTPIQANSGNSVEVSVTISDDESGVWQALISYGPAISSTFTVTETSMNNPTGNSYTFTIPASAQSELGIRYQIKGTNGCSSTSLNPLVVSAEYVDPGLTIPYNAAGTMQSNYRIISIPLNLQNKTVNDVFGDDLQLYGDKSKWRLFSYNNSTDSPTEVSGSTTLDNKKGYWLISAESKPLDTGPGLSNGSADSPVKISVNQGWNLIGNPYPFNILWNDVTSLGANSAISAGALNTFNGQGYSNPAFLKAFEGAFVLAGAAGQLEIPTKKYTGGRIGNGEEELRYNSIDTDDWEVRFSLSSGEITNALSGLGMHPDAQTSFDTFDGFTLPRFFDFLELNHDKFLFEKIPFSRDIIPPANSYEWTFDVLSSVTEEVTITWENEHIQNAQKQLVLWDKEKGIPINMELTNTYSFHAPKSFSVLYGDPSYVREATGSFGLHLFEPYPNPTSGVLEIDFIVPEGLEENIVIDLVNPLGNNISTIINQKFDTGHQHLKWNTFDNGIQPASGLYLIRIQGGKQVHYKKILLK